MAPPKASRKGKKAWRKNIDTDATERALEERAREERQSTAVDVLTDSELFFVDKGRDDGQVAAAKSGALRRPRRREPKPLRCDVVAAAAKTARPVVRPPAPKRKAPVKPATAAGKSGRAAAGAAGPGAPPAPALLDLWAEAPARVTLAEADFAEAAALAVQAQDPDSRPAPKRRRAAAPSQIAAVEVDAPGCSYNPDRGQHQDAVAAAVAAEVRKGLDRELEARPPPRTVDWAPEADPLALLQVDAEADEEDEEEEEEAAGAAGGGGAAAGARAIARKKTRADRNRAGRRRQAEVLLTEEITGSLRTLKAAPALARERFSALQKRGVIEPRVPVVRKGGRGRVSYTAGEKGEATRQGHAALMAARKAAAAALG